MVAHVRRALFALPLALILAVPTFAASPASSSATQPGVNWNWPWHPHPHPPAQNPTQPPVQPPAQPPAQGGDREWTFLIYVNADNNLDPYSVTNIDEMETVGSTDKVAVVVQLERQGSTTDYRYLIQKENDHDTISSPVLQTLPNSDMGSPQCLKDFILWGMQTYPAKKYAVVIWNHGSGWEKRKGGSPLFRGVSYDDGTGNHITVQQVGQVMRDVAATRGGKKIDLLGYDACLMQMVECADEIKDAVAYQAASEEVEPALGYPYQDWLGDVVAHPDWDGKDVGTSLVKRYVASYANGVHGTSDVTYSLIDLSQLDTLNAKLNAFTAACLADASNKPKLTDASQNTQKFYEYSHRDLYDYIDQVTSRINTPAVQAAAGDLRSYLCSRDGSSLIIAAGSTGDSMSKSHGLAIWLPDGLGADDAQLAQYKNLWFAQNSQWSEFLVGIGSSSSRIARAVAGGATFNDAAGIAPVFASPEALGQLRSAIGAHPRTQAVRDLLRAAQGEVFLH